MTTNATITDPKTVSLSGKKNCSQIYRNSLRNSFLLKVSFAFLLFFSPLFVQAQLTASFTIDDTAHCIPMVVNFHNTSVGATSYTWDISDGSALLSLTDVSHIYNTPGIYTITLTAHNGSASSVFTATIHAYGPPTVAFSVPDTSVCPGIPVTFTSTSVPGAWGSLSYDWVIDGLSSALSSPTYAYSAPGYKSVTLTATNSKGCEGYLTKTNYIHVYTPAFVGFTASSTSFCRVPATATFSSAGTIGTPTCTFFWRFGDGGTSPAPNPTHTYTAVGSYTISLKVTDGKGCVDSLVYPSYINVSNLTASFNVTPTSCINSPDTFHNASSPHITSASEWFFGDSGTSSDDTAIHAFAAPGTYNVKLVITDGSCYDTFTHPIVITHPTGSIAISPPVPCSPPIPLTFTATVPSGCTVSWKSMIFGSLGSGTPLTQTFLPMHDLAGNPSGFIDSITMFITNTTTGCKDTVGKRDTVNYLLPDFGESGPFKGCTPLHVHFFGAANSYVYDPFAYAPWYALGYPPPGAVVNPFIEYPYPEPITSYSWNFGDGTPLSTSATPVHTYTLVGGVYSYSLTVTTANGCTQTAVAGGNPVKVGAPPPTPSFVIHPRHACTGRPITFTSSTAGVFDTYSWDFGDGNSDTSADPVHTYTVPGIFHVDFGLSYNGCMSDSLYHVSDSMDSPSAVISLHYDCIPRNEITLRDSSFGDNAHLWQFGDGATSTAGSQIHDYPSVTAIYTVTLSTFNAASGCRDTTHALISLKGLNAVITPKVTSICNNLVDSFIVHILDTESIDTSYAAKYRWFYGGVCFDSVVRNYFFDSTTVTFHTPGMNTVTLLMTDNHGCFDTFYSHVNVAQPVDSFSYTLSTGCAPVPVHFTDHSSDVAGFALTNYYWLFGDGDTLSASTGALITHTYSLGGTYTVEEIVTDNIGCKDTMVSASHPVVHKPTASFSVYSTNVCAGSYAHFINTSTGIVSSIWFFGDGDTSSLTAPTHIYAAPGVYTVKLVITGLYGCTDTAISAAYITVNPKPSVSFSMSDSFAVCPPLNIVCTNTTTGATSYYWTFGTIASYSSFSPSGVFSSPGLYAVKLYATNSFGCTDSSIHHASVFGYSGAFSYTPVSGCAPLKVHFTSTLTTVSSIIWDFSDGVISTVSSMDTISHKYTTTGSYLPKLVLIDTAGCSAFSYGIDTIKVDSLIPKFGFTPNPVCEGNTMSFADSSVSYFSSSTSWLCTFAPGATSTVSAPTYAYSVTGVHPISFTVTNGSGCSHTLTKNVTVNTTPTAISGGNVVCPGSTLPLTDSVTGGVWSTASTAVSVNPTSGVVMGLSSGTALITYSLGLGCVATKMITVSVISPILGPTGVCAGDTLLLSDPGGGTWSSSAGGIATVGSSTGVVRGVSPGTATITYALSAGCSTIKVITVNTAPTSITGSSRVCLLGTVTLSDTAGGGVWSIAPLTTATIGPSSGIVTGVALGAASVTYSLGFGCVRYYSMTVSPLPTPISGTKHICAGSVTTLIDTTLGGLWSTTSPLATVGSVSGAVTGISAGTPAITYTEGGCIVTTTVTVNPLPAPITGLSSVCTGSTIILADTSHGGTWKGSNPAVATIVTGSGSVTGITIGTTVDTYTLPTGCFTTATINVFSVPASISGAMHVCPGTTTLLTDSTSGGIWSSPGGAGTLSIGSSSGIVTGSVLGAATVTYSLGGSCFRTAIVTVNSVPVPISGSSMVCLGSSSTLTDSPPGGAWSSSNPLIVSVGSATGAITGGSVGAATITYSLGLGCSISTLISVDPLPPAITGPTSLCLGYTALLHETGTGGAWSSSVPAVGTVSSSGLVTSGLSGGVTVISYTIASGCAATYAVDVISVPPITGIANICAYGSTIHVADSLPGGIWTASLVTVSDSGFVTSYAAGPATIYYTVTGGCYTSSPLTVYPLPAPISGSPRLCVGLSTALADSSFGGVWSSGSLPVAAIGSSTGVVVAGLSAGTSNITYKLPTGCIEQVTVTVSPLPSPLTGTESVCAGATTALGDTSGGGTWASSNTAVATAGSVSGVITGVSAGTATITYTLAPSCSITGTVTVNPLPASFPLTGGGSYCVGGARLHVGLGGSLSGTGYQLFNGSSPSGGAMGGTGSALDFGIETPAGTYRVVATTTATGCSRLLPDSAVINILGTIAPSVSISALPGDTVCSGMPVTFVAAPSNGGSTPVYKWSVNGANEGTDSVHYTYTPSAADVIGVMMISSEPCASPDTVLQTLDIDVVTSLFPVVTISATPDTTVLIGQSVTLIAVASGAGTTPAPSYQWFKGGIAIPGATNQSYASDFNDGDVITCTVTSNGACGGHSGTYKVTIHVINNESVSVPGQGAGQLRVVPNPNKGEFTLSGSVGSPVNATGDEEVLVEMKDVLGQVVYKSKITAHSGLINERIKLNGAVANGSYLLTVSSGTGNAVFHLMVEQ